MTVIDVGTLIYFTGVGTDQSETFRVPEGKRMTAVLETIAINMSTGTTNKVVITIQQSSDLRNWTDVNFSAAHELNSAPDFVRSDSAAATSPGYIVQPYVRLKYDGSTGASGQVFLFSAQISLTET